MKKRRLTKEAARKRALCHAFAKLLLRYPVKHVKFSGNKCSLVFLGNKISDKVTRKREPHVAEWSRRRKEIFIDKKITPGDRRKSFKALCVHEILEKFLTEKFGLRANIEAHEIATQKEKEYLKSISGNWRSHSLIVYWDWHRMGEH